MSDLGPRPDQPPEPDAGRAEPSCTGHPEDPYEPLPTPRGQSVETYGQQRAPWPDHVRRAGDSTAMPTGHNGHPQPTGHPGYGSFHRHEPTNPPHPAWPSTGPAPCERKRSTPLIALLVTAAMLVLGGGAAAAYLVGRNGGPTNGSSVSGPAIDPATSTATITTSAPGYLAGTPAPGSSTDARFVKVGQCVKNEGDADGRPKLAITGCASKTYEVLRRFDGATDGKQDATTKCSKVEGYTDWYFFNSELDALDFVLCLKLR